MPKAFAKLHPRYRTPHVALIVQSIAASAIFLGSVFFSVAGRSTSIQEAYDILVNLTILIYFVPYLYLFAAQIRLLPQSPRSLAALGFAATAISLGLTFVPPPGSDAVTYEVNLIAQAGIMLGVGFGFYAWSRRSAAR
jgi:amino acid transporter